MEKINKATVEYVPGCVCLVLHIKSFSFIRSASLQKNLQKPVNNLGVNSIKGLLISGFALCLIACTRYFSAFLPLISPETKNFCLFLKINDQNDKKFSRATLMIIHFHCAFSSKIATNVQMPVSVSTFLLLTYETIIKIGTYD
ncbi:hypothetical protein [Thalassomonas actiniarum]|uniref:Uncharacterized protein n=1 Tax=Thalassomonas actiniarum TaxID=485447 RepID=A0AAF0C1D4_9GAMM|nr:hypothetical protein [Thalassomonas actiniarum]WDD96624.1 hypothetical protein SG35_014670 [Thalassomonas actiniarum]